MLSLSKRKAPFRKRKSISPEETQEYIQQENILGYPVDISSIEIACARTYCAAITANNTVIIWGDGDYSSTGIKRVPKNATDIQQIAAGDNWIVALKKDGTLVSWGVQGFEDMKPPMLSNVVKVVAFGNNYLALLDDGTIQGWGFSETFDIKDMPQSIFENSIEDISVGFNHAVALTSKGRVIIWGNEGNVQFPKIESKIVSVKTFGNFNLALQENGKLLGWGSTEFGQELFPEELNDENVISYAIGMSHCAAITESGKFYTWGWNVSPTKQYTELIEYISGGKVKEKRVRINVEEKKYFIAAPEDAFKVEDESPVKVYCGYDVTYVVMDSGDIVGWGDKKYDLLDVPEVVPALERLNQPNIDLRPFGINLNVDDVIQNKYVANMNLVKPLQDSSDSWITQSGTYKKGRLLGQGTFGTAYIATKDGVEMAVKSINLFEKEDPSRRFQAQILEGNIQEVTVQLIIQEEIKRLNPGFRVCGEIYEIAVDPIKKLFYIFQEKLDMTLDKYVEKMKPSNQVFADLMIQMADKLNWMYDNLEYNHRDFKDDNAMVKFTGSDSVPEFLLIDFGYSCMTYRGIRIKVKTGYFGETEKCFQETRDITFMLFTVYKHALKSRTLSQEMLKVLRSMLIFKVKGKTCNVADQDCPFERNISEQNWQYDLYDILNVDYVYNPNATTDKLIEKMTPFLEESY